MPEIEHWREREWRLYWSASDDEDIINTTMVRRHMGLRHEKKVTLLR